MRSKPKRNKFKIFFLIAMIVWIVFIWSNSIYSVEDSDAQSRFVEQFLTPILDYIEIPMALRQFYLRKCAHILEFFALGVLSTLLFKGKRVYFPLLISLFIAGADESIQYFTGRGNQLSDVGIDFAGACAGIFITWLIIFIVNYIKGKKREKSRSRDYYRR